MFKILTKVKNKDKTKSFVLTSQQAFFSNDIEDKTRLTTR